jgi:hypothetical protein
MLLAVRPPPCPPAASAATAPSALACVPESEAGIRPSGPFFLSPRLADILDGARQAFQRGKAPALTREGEGGTYFLPAPADAAPWEDPQYLACFKPRDEEQCAPLNPKGNRGAFGGATLRSGVYSGEGAWREVAAYMLDAGGLAGVPHTALAVAWHTAFQNVVPGSGGAEDDVHRSAGAKSTPAAAAGPRKWGKSALNRDRSSSGSGGGSGSEALPAAPPPRPKVGSLQAFVRGRVDRSWTDRRVQAALPDLEVHKVALLDMRLLNLDRNEDNVLVVEAEDGGGGHAAEGSDHTHNSGPSHTTSSSSSSSSSSDNSNSRYRLVPIDHGYILPGDVGVDDYDWAWLDFPHLERPLHPRLHAAFFAIDVERDIAVLRAAFGHAIRPACFNTYRLTHAVIRKGLERCMTLKQIACLLCRVMPQDRSRLQQWVGTASLLATATGPGARMAFATAAAAAAAVTVASSASSALAPSSGPTTHNTHALPAAERATAHAASGAAGAATALPLRARSEGLAAGGSHLHGGLQGGICTSSTAACAAAAAPSSTAMALAAGCSGEGISTAPASLASSPAAPESAEPAVRSSSFFPAAALPPAPSAAASSVAAASEVATTLAAMAFGQGRAEDWASNAEEAVLATAEAASAAVVGGRAALVANLRVTIPAAAPQPVGSLSAAPDALGNSKVELLTPAVQVVADEAELSFTSVPRVQSIADPSVEAVAATDTAPISTRTLATRLGDTEDDGNSSIVSGTAEADEDTDEHATSIVEALNAPTTPVPSGPSESSILSPTHEADASTDASIDANPNGSASVAPQARAPEEHAPRHHHHHHTALVPDGTAVSTVASSLGVVASAAAMRAASAIPGRQRARIKMKPLATLAGMLGINAKMRFLQESGAEVMVAVAISADVTLLGDDGEDTSGAPTMSGHGTGSGMGSGAATGTANGARPAGYMQPTATAPGLPRSFTFLDSLPTEPTGLPRVDNIATTTVASATFGANKSPMAASGSDWHLGNSFFSPSDAGGSSGSGGMPPAAPSPAAAAIPRSGSLSLFPGAGFSGTIRTLSHTSHGSSGSLNRRGAQGPNPAAQYAMAKLLAMPASIPAHASPSVVAPSVACVSPLAVRVDGLASEDVLMHRELADIAAQDAASASAPPSPPAGVVEMRNYAPLAGSVGAAALALNPETPWPQAFQLYGENAWESITAIAVVVSIRGKLAVACGIPRGRDIVLVEQQEVIAGLSAVVAAALGAAALGSAATGAAPTSSSPTGGADERLAALVGSITRRLRQNTARAPVPVPAASTAPASKLLAPVDVAPAPANDLLPRTMAFGAHSAIPANAVDMHASLPRRSVTHDHTFPARTMTLGNADTFPSRAYSSTLLSVATASSSGGPAVVSSPYRSSFRVGRVTSLTAAPVSALGSPAFDGFSMGNGSTAYSSPSEAPLAPVLSLPPLPFPQPTSTFSIPHASSDWGRMDSVTTRDLPASFRTPWDHSVVGKHQRHLRHRFLSGARSLAARLEPQDTGLASTQAPIGYSAVGNSSNSLSSLDRSLDRSLGSPWPSETLAGAEGAPAAQATASSPTGMFDPSSFHEELTPAVALVISVAKVEQLIPSAFLPPPPQSCAPAPVAAAESSSVTHVRSSLETAPSSPTDDLSPAGSTSSTISSIAMATAATEDAKPAYAPSSPEKYISHSDVAGITHAAEQAGSRAGRLCLRLASNAIVEEEDAAQTGCCNLLALVQGGDNARIITYRPYGSRDSYQAFDRDAGDHSRGGGDSDTRGASTPRIGLYADGSVDAHADTPVASMDTAALSGLTRVGTIAPASRLVPRIDTAFLPSTLSFAVPAATSGLPPAAPGSARTPIYPRILQLRSEMAAERPPPVAPPAPATGLLPSVFSVTPLGGSISPPLPSPSIGAAAQLEGQSPGRSPQLSPTKIASPEAFGITPSLCQQNSRSAAPADVPVDVLPQEPFGHHGLAPLALSLPSESERETDTQSSPPTVSAAPREGLLPFSQSIAGEQMRQHQQHMMSIDDAAAFHFPAYGTTVDPVGGSGGASRQSAVQHTGLRRAVSVSGDIGRLQEISARRLQAASGYNSIPTSEGTSIPTESAKGSTLSGSTKSSLQPQSSPLGASTYLSSSSASLGGANLSAASIPSGSLAPAFVSSLISRSETYHIDSGLRTPGPFGLSPSLPVATSVGPLSVGGEGSGVSGGLRRMASAAVLSKFPGSASTGAPITDRAAGDGVSEHSIGAMIGSNVPLVIDRGSLSGQQSLWGQMPLATSATAGGGTTAGRRGFGSGGTAVGSSEYDRLFLLHFAKLVDGFLRDWDRDGRPAFDGERKRFPLDDD